MEQEPLTADEQTAILADRYSLRADAYDTLWSPVIRTVGERLLSRLPLTTANDVIDVGTGSGALLPLIQEKVPAATILGVDNSEGMLRLARNKHHGPLALMDVQKLELADDCFDVAVIAFVLFHLPRPDKCLGEVARVLRPGGVVGTVTWGAEQAPGADSIWDQELDASGATVRILPAVDNRGCCDSTKKIAALMAGARLGSVRAWTEPIEHQWQPADHFEYHVLSASRLRLVSLEPDERDRCVGRVRYRLSQLGKDDYVFRGEVVMATATKGRER